MRGHLKFLAIAAAVSALLVIAVPASALTGGELDGDQHPNVGLLLVGGRPACSGVLVSPRIFVTAGHCGPHGARVAVTFDSSLAGDVTLAAGRLLVDPEFGHDMARLHDLAVVRLDVAQSIAPASLPEAGALDGLVNRAILTTVGYGLHDVAKAGGKKRLDFDGERRFGAVVVNALTPTYAKVGQAPTGLCFGDSGGPLLDGSTVLAVTSHGAAACEGNTAMYRLDTAAARDFLARFVALP